MPRMPNLVVSHVQSGGREIFFAKPIGSLDNYGHKILRLCPTVMVGIGARVVNWATRTRGAPCLALKVKTGGFVGNTWTLAFEVDWQEVIS